MTRPLFPRASLPLWLNAVLVPAVLLALGVAFASSPKRDVVSAVENRKLAAMPALSWPAVRDGTYTRDVELFISDHFPLRERFVRVASAFRAGFGVTTHTAFYESKSADEGGLENVNDWEPLSDDVVDGGMIENVSKHFDDGTHPAQNPPPIEQSGAHDDKVPSSVAKVSKNGVLIVDGRAMVVFTGDDESAAQFADVINGVHKALVRAAASKGADSEPAALYVVVTPTATPFYLPDSAKDRTRSEKDNLDVMRAHVDDGVHFPDVYAALDAHKGEDIFLKTDHHWTAIGAYYAYKAFCDAAGIAAVPRDGMVKKTRPPTLGSLYRMTQDRSLLESKDAVDYFLPVEHSAVRYGKDDGATRTQVVVDGEAGYLVFLGGDWPLEVAKTPVDDDSAAKGRRVLLVKNSFGNAFAPFLLPHFEETVIVDYRYTDKSILELVKSHAITDVILLVDTVTANSAPHRRRIAHITYSGSDAWKTEIEKKHEAEADGGPVKATQENQ